MKLVLVNEVGTFNISTDIVYKDKEPKYHNIKFGSKGKGLWRVTFGVCKTIANVEDNKSSISLEDDDYVLYPIYKNNKHKEDSSGRKLYYICKDSKQSKIDRKKILAFIEIPNHFYNNITYTLSGNCELVTEGYNGQRINDRLYKSPYPVVLVDGDMTLKWEGYDKENKKITQTIRYDGKEWYVTQVSQQE